MSANDEHAQHPADRPIRIKVDEDWKKKAFQEKSVAAGEPDPATGPGPETGKRGAGETGKAQSPPPGGPPSKPFLNLLTSLGTQAAYQLGMEANPYTGRAEIDIEGARFTIDTLDMLKAKTAGNLIPGESRALEGLLHELQLAYVEAARAVQQAMLKRNPPPGGGKGPLSNR